MAVKNLECQLAMAQLRRYLAGAALSDDALEALEGHLASCSDCQREVADRRNELVVSGQQNAPTHAAVNLPNQNLAQPQQPARMQTSQAVVEAEIPRTEPKAKTAKQEKAPRQSMGMKIIQSGLNQPWIEKIPGGAKTFLLSVGLAGLLVAMSTLSQNPKAWLGESAESAIADNLVRKESNKDNANGAARYELSKFDGANASTTEKVVLGSSVNRTEPQGTPKAPQKVKTNKPATSTSKAAQKPVAIQKPAVKAKPKTTNISKPKPRAATARPAITTKPRRKVTKPAPRASRVRRAPAKSTPKPRSKPNSGVRIYDENGNAIN